MSGLEVAAISLSTAIAKSAAKLWLRDHAIAANISASAIDAIGAKATNLFDKRHVNRTFDEIIDTVAKKLTPYIETELKGLPENEKAAAVIAVADTFNSAPLADNYLFSNDLNAAYIDRYLRNKVPGVARRALLSEGATELYNVLLRESCEYLVQVTLALPQFQPGVLTEILKRSTEIITGLQDILNRLPERKDSGDADAFTIDYRRQVINQLDRMELFGATLSEASRRYPLSVAYISLNLSSEARGIKPPGSKLSDDRLNGLNVTVESGLAKESRLFIRGEAGSGKTTLLKWVAVHSARRDFPAQLDHWNSVIPFFVPLRRYVEKELPSLDKFPSAVGRFISNEMPSGYVLETLRSGNAAVLIDGLDEFPSEKREEAREWLDDLISSFPDAKYIITSRPGAVAPGWLGKEAFAEYELLPMPLTDIRAFISHWHEAMRSAASDADERTDLTDFEHQLIDRISSRRHLKVLAETPLLCALLCALHRDRRGQLPNNRMELYDVALEMLLERRDAERHVISDTTISRTEKTLLLQDIAYWLIRNGWSDAGKSQVIERLEGKLAYMSQISASPRIVYQHLLERSGLIREPAADRVDFVHKTFQEYLAALDALAVNDIGLLIDHAHLDQWREVVIMAAGHAFASKREELLGGLVKKGDEDPQHRDELHLLAVACLETSPELSQTLRDEIRIRVQGLLPPKNLTAAKSMASAGEFVVDLLAQSKPRLATEVAATIRAAAEIGTDSALRVIAGFKDDIRFTVFKQILQAWQQFDAEEYARQVLSYSRWVNSSLRIGSPDLFPGLRYLPHVRALVVSVRGAVDLQFLRHLTELERFSIEDSPIINSQELRNCPKLKHLDLEGTDIGDVSCLNNFAELKYLNLNRTAVSDLSPLAAAHDLRELYLLGTPVADLSVLEDMTKMRRLDLDSTKVVDLRPLAALNQLELLDVRKTEVSDLTSLREMKKLISFFAQSTRISDLSPLSAAVNLKTVSVPDTLVRDLTPLVRLTDLLYLDVTNTNVADIAVVAEMKKIQKLLLMRTSVSDISALAGLPHLDDLNLSDTRVNDIEPLREAKRLQNLHLSNCNISDIEPLRSLSNLRYLQLRGTAVADLSPISKLPRLYQLDISKTPVSDVSVLENSPIRYLTVDEKLYRDSGRHFRNRARFMIVPSTAGPR